MSLVKDSQNKAYKMNHLFPYLLIILPLGHINIIICKFYLW
jgi:hypothetical protein